MLKIIAIGKKTDHDQAIDQYLKRLRKPYDCKITLLNFSHEKDLAARKNESEAILNRIEDDDFVILLDENGKELNNHQLNDKIKQNYGKLVFIIGGPYGVDQRLIKRANFIWSLGKLIYPYEIARLILIEQIYRSQSIEFHHPYHHQ